MATERQIAANRRNAVKSTGPRSSAGKRRARRNSYRHGLSIGTAGRPGCAEHVERVARKIAGAGADAMVLEQARSIAQAQLDLTQIRRMRASLIQRMAEFGVLDTPDPLATFVTSNESWNQSIAGCHGIYLSLQRQACPHRNPTAQPKP